MGVRRRECVRAAQHRARMRQLPDVAAALAGGRVRGVRLPARAALGHATRPAAADGAVQRTADAVHQETAAAVHDVHAGPGAGLQAVVQIGYLHPESVPHNDGDAGMQQAHNRIESIAFQ